MLLISSSYYFRVEHSPIYFDIKKLYIYICVCVCVYNWYFTRHNLRPLESPLCELSVGKLWVFIVRIICTT
jgi:hypothetical protein